jgi:hypothetical protein
MLIIWSEDGRLPRIFSLRQIWSLFITMGFMRLVASPYPIRRKCAAKFPHGCF